MNRSIFGVLAVGSLLVATACDEPPVQQTASPSMQASVAATSTSCSFTAMNPLVAHYFTQPEQGQVTDIINAMQAAGSFTPEARDSGFSVMSHIARNIDNNNPNSTDAASLTNALLACMYDVNNANDTAALPATFPENFNIATDPASAAHGAYAVRGGGADPASAGVYNRPYTNPFTVVAPPTIWQTSLSGNLAPRRILVYGKPGSNPYSYDWKVIPRNTLFAPQVIVGVCLSADDNLTSMLNEQNVGLLTFFDVGTNLLDLDTCAGALSLKTGSGPLMVARRALHSLFSVPVAHARSLVMNPGGIGGSTGSIHSEFSALALQGVTVKFQSQPPSVVKVCATPPCSSGGFSVDVKATSTTSLGTFAVGGVTLHLAAYNNNGTPADLYQCTGTTCTKDPTATTDNTGVATFGTLFLNKTGGYKLVVTNGKVSGREGAIPVGSATSNKFNVKP